MWKCIDFDSFGSGFRFWSNFFWFFSFGWLFYGFALSNGPPPFSCTGSKREIPSGQDGLISSPSNSQSEYRICFILSTGTVSDITIIFMIYRHTCQKKQKFVPNFCFGHGIDIFNYSQNVRGSCKCYHLPILYQLIKLLSHRANRT